jgi:hypothetical protein
MEQARQELEAAVEELDLEALELAVRQQVWVPWSEG